MKISTRHSITESCKKSEEGLRPSQCSVKAKDSRNGPEVRITYI